MDINSQKVMDCLRNGSIGHTIIHYTALPSTMITAKELAVSSQIRSGTIVLAEEQTAGRGRLQREWMTPMGAALLMTVILKPPHLRDALSLHLLPMVLGVALADSLEATVPALCGQVMLKWPNDILIGNISSEKQGKVAGLLIETIYQDTLAYALLGIGLNVNQTQEELPSTPVGKPQPTSIRGAVGHPVEREMLLKNFCQHLEKWLVGPFVDSHKSMPTHSNNRGTDVIYQAWRDRLCTLGQSVMFSSSDSEDAPTHSGIVIDVTPAGSLVIQDSDGQCHTFTAGDVTLRKHV